MSWMCRECHNTFDEPRVCVETHGFLNGPYERFEECPWCGSCDFDDEFIVQHEIEYDAELEAYLEEVAI